MLIVSSRIQIPDSELRFSYARSSGPGGQNVNKVASKAILHWSTQSESISPTVRERLLELFSTRVTNAGDFVISSDRFRDQRQNAEDCLDRLREMLQAACRPVKKRRATRPSQASRRRRLEDKRQQSVKKQGRRSLDRPD